MSSTTFNTLQSIKRRFFAMRNGVIADTMRRAGDSHRIIFGLNLPQIAEIARDHYGDTALAAQLWENRTTRESRLAAPMLYPPAQMPMQLAKEWAADACGNEETDILCHKLLRRLPGALMLLDDLVKEQGATYLTMRLALNLLPKSLDTARALACAAPDSLGALRRQLQQEIEFLSEDPMSAD